ncbi:MAG: hypothetical protein U1A72_15580 [Sulfuritalea sp.]|nr:hypothetical protein [Sulfuritalea sp.]
MIQLIAALDIGSCIWCPPTKSGDAVWVRDEHAARHLIEHGFCKLPDGPAEAPLASEVKPAGPAFRKHSAGAVHGRSIASASLKGLGSGRLSSASAAALVSPQRL